MGRRNGSSWPMLPHESQRWGEGARAHKSRYGLIGSLKMRGRSCGFCRRNLCDGRKKGGHITRAKIKKGGRGGNAQKWFEK